MSSYINDEYDDIKDSTSQDVVVEYNNTPDYGQKSGIYDKEAVFLYVVQALFVLFNKGREFSDSNSGAVGKSGCENSIPTNDIRAIAQFQILMVAAYALGIASPKEFFEMPDLAIKRVAESLDRIMEKLAGWAKYGEIIGVRDLTADINHAYKTGYMWMITDQHVIIITAIKNNLKSSTGCSELFNEKWNFEGGILSDLSEFTSYLFKEAAPNTLVIDDSIDRINFHSFIRPSHDYSPITSLSDVIYCHSLNWVKRIVFPSKIQFVPETFDYAYVRAYESMKRERDFFDEEDYRSYMDLPNNIFDKGVEIYFSDSNRPYYIKNNIIYRTSDNTEVYCLDTNTRRTRYIREFDRGVKAVQDEWKHQQRCQYCGGSFCGVFVKKCSDCGRKMDYKLEYDPQVNSTQDRIGYPCNNSFEDLLKIAEQKGVHIPDFLNE